jgi:RNA polymerase-binding protein DksA
MTEPNANTTVRYSDTDLGEFREIVEKKLEKAKEELNYLQEQILEITENSGDDHGGDWMDDSSTNNDIEFLNNMAIRQRKYIQDLENALVRIKNKSYGICIVTGHLIDKRRLIAVPTATKSVEAKNAEAQKAEKTGEKKPETSPELLEKLEKVEVPATPKIITKVIRKPKTPPVKPVNVEDEDDVLFDELDKNYPYESDEDDSSDDEMDIDKDTGSDQNEEYDDESEYNF